MAKLSKNEVNDYQKKGYVVPNYRLPNQKLHLLEEAVDELVQNNPSVPPEYLIGPHIAQSTNRKHKVLSKKFLDFCLDSDILDMVEGILGKNVILWSSGVFCKPAKLGRVVPWHQDGQYWPIRPLAVCSVWIAIDDALPENGCMRFIPGSHTGSRLYQHVAVNEHNAVLNQGVKPSEFDKSKAVDNALLAGQLSIHDVYLIHGSNANTSGRRRAGYVMRYMPGTSVYDREMPVGQSSDLAQSDFSERPIWLARGVDCTGANDFLLGHE